MEVGRQCPRSRLLLFQPRPLRLQFQPDLGDLETGRVYVAATSTTPGRGALYGLDLRRGVEEGMPRVTIAIAFAAEMGPGSGSSPALSPAGHRVYVSDETGRFYAVDAQDGAIVWEVETKATSAAAAVGADGTVYALQAYGPALVAITETGGVRWESDLAALAEKSRERFEGVAAKLGPRPKRPERPALTEDYWESLRQLFIMKELLDPPLSEREI